MPLRMAFRYQLFQAWAARPGLALRPQILQGVPQRVDDEQAVVGGQQLIEFDVFARPQRVPVLQQQPAGTLDDAPARPVAPEFIGPIHPHPVDNLPPVLGHDVEQVSGKNPHKIPTVEISRASVRRGSGNHAGC